MQAQAQVQVQVQAQVQVQEQVQAQAQEQERGSPLIISSSPTRGTSASKKKMLVALG